MTTSGRYRLALQCGAPTSLSLAERQRLHTAPWDAGPPEHVACALQNRHSGAHMAFLRRRHIIEASAWWLVWDHASRDCRPLAACTAYHASHHGYHTCRLPADHAGHHSWLLAGPRPRPVPAPA